MRIKFFEGWCLILFCMGLVFATKAASVAEKDAFELLKKANTVMAALKSFSAEEVQSSDKDDNSFAAQKLFYFERHNPDGTADKRSETWSKDKMGKKVLKNIYITNREGSYEIIGETALRLIFQEKAVQNALQNTEGEKPAGAEKLEDKTKDHLYEMSEGIFNGIECYILMDTMTDALFENMEKSMLAAAKVSEGKLNLDPKNFIPFKAIYYIGKNDFFIYSQINYNRKGEKISEHTYKSVKQNVVLPDNLFQIPNGYKIIRVESVVDYANALAAPYKKKK